MRFILQNRKIRKEQISSNNDLVLWFVTPCSLVQWYCIDVGINSAASISRYLYMPKYCQRNTAVKTPKLIPHRGYRLTNCMKRPSQNLTRQTM